jgi:hypothetical protein
MTTIMTAQPASTGAPRFALLRVGGIWAAAALPMGILGWIIAPDLSPDIESNPVGAVVTRLAALTLGLIWLFILSLMMIYRHLLVAYFALAFAGAWGVQFPLLLSQDGLGLLPYTLPMLPAMLLFLLSVWASLALAAFAVTATESGRAGVRTFLSHADATSASTDTPRDALDEGQGDAKGATS